MSFFNYIDSKLGRPVPHKLPDPTFDDDHPPKFNRIRIRCSPLDETENVTMETAIRSFRGDLENRSTFQIGMVKVSAEIFHHRFLSCFEQFNDDNLQGRIIITDVSSLSMLNRAIDWLTLKRSGVSCIFNLTDKLSNELTRSLQIIYLINIVNLTAREFDKFKTSLASRECRECSIFFTYLIDPFSSKAINRLKQLKELIIRKSIPSPWIVGAFHAVSPWLALIDHQANLNYLRKSIKSPLSSQDNQNNRVACCRLAFRLVNLFEQMNQFPIVRYMKTWHSHNQLIGQLFVRGMNGLRDKRQMALRGQLGTPEITKYGTDYLLIIIDRSVDMLTPILHADHYEAFVEQELDTKFPRSTDKLDSEIRNSHINDVAFKLKAQSQSLKLMNGKISVKDQEIIMNFVRSHLSMVTRLTEKINNGYRVLLQLEQKVVKQLNTNFNVKQVKLKRIGSTEIETSTLNSRLSTDIYPDVTPLDLHRLMIIRSLVSRKLLGTKCLRTFFGGKRFPKKDKLDDDKYAELIKKYIKKSGTGQFGFPVIANLIESNYSRTLSEDKFPFVESWMKNTAPRKKLCIFVLGGISYNEIQYSGVFTTPAQDVTLISDNLITANDILTKLFS